MTSKDTKRLQGASSLDGFDALLDRHPDPAWIIDLDTLRFVKANEAAVAAFAGSREELLGLKILDVLSPEEVDRYRRILFRARSEPPPWPLREKMMMRGTNGVVFPLYLAAHTLESAGRKCRVVISSAKPAEGDTRERIRPDRRHDALTGLPDRSHLLDRIRQSRSKRDAPFAVLVLDIDRFRLLNRSLGLEAGDRLLEAVAKRLESQIQPDEALVRIRADEFAVLLQDIGTPEAAHHMAREFQEELEAPFLLNDREVRLTASVGVALEGPEATTPEELLDNAQVALHEAQGAGIRSCRIFAPEMGKLANQLLRLEMDIGPGLARGDLSVRFQPLVSLRAGRIAGFEALARWQHPTLGMIMPGQFIPMAERTGHIGDLGLQVLRDACGQMGEWQRRFRFDPPLFLTVNCSAVQFFDPKLAMQVKGALTESGLAPKSLKLELTESVLMEDNPRTMEPFERILDLGVQIMIDDFGTGFSSLSRLHQLPIEALKIDRTFVSGLTERLDSLSVVRAIVQLARNFALKVTAEGVENLEQLRALRLLECDFGQGYYFAKPLETAEALKLLEDDQRW